MTPAETLRALVPGGTFKTLCKVAPVGSLQARKQRDGVVVFAWRFSVTVDGVERESRAAIGRFDATLPPKSLKPTGDRYSLAAAIRAAESLAEQHVAKRDAGGMLAVRAEQKAAQDEAREVARADATLTLAQLMTDYVEHLRRRKSPSVSQATTALNHVKRVPRVATKAARLVTVPDVADAMRPLHDAGKTRSANKVRSYISAAYGVAKAARSDGSIAATFKAYGITTNPAAEAAVIHDDDGDEPRVIRALTIPELRAYWNVIRTVPGLQGAVLRLHLLTGGQRPEQLMKLRTRDDFGDYVLIYDGKGKSRKLRPHAVPIIPAARAALEAAKTDAPCGVFALSSDGGATHVHGTTFSKWATEVVAAARAAGDENAKALPSDFTPKLIRSGIETALAANRVPEEIRGRLQSHGISGVQDRHYNAHDYLDEKRECVELIHQLLTARRLPSKVVPLRGVKG